MEAKGIKSLLNSEDPLSDAAIDALLGHREEDGFVDYKVDFHPDSEKEWLGITKDALAFANTYGGYLVFGVENGTFARVGVTDEVCRALSDANRVMQKLNRCIGPPFSQIRAKQIEREGKKFVVICVPESKGKTHIVTQPGAYQDPSRGKSKTLLHTGMLFVRRPAGNHHVTDTDALESLLERRLEQYRKSLFDKIARVVEAPAAHEVLVFDPSSASDGGKKFTISDAPDAIPIKGMSFTVTPSTDEQEVSAWIALSRKDPNFVAPEASLWRLYARRVELKLSTAQEAEMARFSLRIGLPVFFWVRGFFADKLKELLREGISAADSVMTKAYVVQVGAFLGKGFHSELLRKAGAAAARLGRAGQFPAGGPREFFPSSSYAVAARARTGRRTAQRQAASELVDTLTRVACELADGQGGVLEKHKALVLDCELYARDDRYQGPPEVSSETT